MEINRIGNIINNNKYCNYNYNWNKYNNNNYSRKFNYYNNSNNIINNNTHNNINQFNYNNYLYNYNYNYFNHNNSNISNNYNQDYHNIFERHKNFRKKKYIKKKKKKNKPPPPKKVPDQEYDYLKQWKKKTRKLMRLTLQRRNWVMMKNHFQWFRKNLLYKTKLQIGYENKNHRMRKSIQSNNLNHMFRNATTMINNISRYINQEKKELKRIYIIMQKLKGSKEFNLNIKYFYENFLKQDEKDGINKCLINIEKIWNHKKWRRKNMKNMIKINIKKCIHDDLLNNIIFKQIKLEKYQIKTLLRNKNKSINNGELRIKFDKLIQDLASKYSNNQYNISQCGRFVKFEKLSYYKKFMRLSLKYEFENNLKEITKNNAYINNQKRYAKLVKKKMEEKEKEKRNTTTTETEKQNNININANNKENKDRMMEKRNGNNNSNENSENNNINTIIQ